MVKPLKYESGKHLPFADKDKLSAGLVPISSQSGNLLQERTDGLYYGIEAPPDTSALYVSTSLGSDETGNGTKAKPYKTLGKAYSMNSPSVSCTIYLRYGETYVLDRGISSTNGAVKTFTTWDDPKHEQTLATDPSINRALWEPIYYADTGFATILLGGHFVNSTGKGGRYHFACDSNSGMDFTNIEFRLKSDKTISQVAEEAGVDPTSNGVMWWEGSVFYGEGGLVTLHACRIVIPNESDLDLRGYVTFSSYSSRGNTGPKLLFDTTQLVDKRTDTSTAYTVFQYQYSGELTVDDQTVEDKWITAWGEEPLRGNMKESLESGKYITGLVRDSNGSVTNVVSNVVL